jgi:hypothetical protein
MSIAIDDNLSLYHCEEITMDSLFSYMFEPMYLRVIGICLLDFRLLAGSHVSKEFYNLKNIYLVKNIFVYFFQIT